MLVPRFLLRAGGPTAAAAAAAASAAAASLRPQRRFCAAAPAAPRVPARYHAAVDAAKLQAVGLVVPPLPAAEAAMRRRCVLVDLHETLVRVEPVGGSAADVRGAPAAACESGWGTAAAPNVIQGPAGAGDFLLNVRPGTDEVMAVLKENEAVEGVLWTVGGLLYVAAVIDAIEGLGGGRAAGVGFRNIVRSDSNQFCEKDGAVLGRSEWPFLHDLKPLALVPRPVDDCLQVDDRPEYLRCNPDNALIVRPYTGKADEQLLKVAEIVRLLAASPLSVQDFLKELPTNLAVKQDMGNGTVMSCVV